MLLIVFEMYEMCGFWVLFFFLCCVIFKNRVEIFKRFFFLKLKIPKQPSFCPEPVTLKFRLELPAEVSQGKNC